MALVDEHDTNFLEIEDKDEKIRNWLITCNNPTQQTHDRIESQKNCQYLFQYEKGDKTGTVHIQGILIFKNGRTWKQLRKSLGEFWFRKARNVNACKNYCKKSKTRQGHKFYTNILEYLMLQIEDPLDGKELFYFQKQVLDIIKEKPDNRTIHWFWEDEGCTGKTSLAKHIVLNDKNAYVIGGKASDLKFAIQNLVSKGKPPRTLIMNIPRSRQEYVSYEGIEAAKDGLFFSGKYEGGMVVYNCPHIIIFANFEPDVGQLSEDRWNIVNIAN